MPHLQIREPLSLRLQIEELSLSCHRIGEPPLLRLWIEKPTSSRYRGAIAAVPSESGSHVAAALDWRADTITPSDRGAAAASSDLGSTVAASRA
jgi:hypothetical protein